MIFPLLQDFADVLNAMPQEHPRYRILKLLDEAIRRDVHFIDRHPTTFFQCMWNTCWWYDCPEAAGHYEEPEEGWEKAPWQCSSPKLHVLLNEWKNEKHGRTPEQLWIRSLRPPANHLGGRLHAALPHRSAVTDVAFSPNGRWIASVAGGFLHVWDPGTCSLINCLPEAGSSVGFSPDSDSIISSSNDGTIRVWNVETAQQRLCLRLAHGASATHFSRASFDSTGRRILSCMGDSIQIWDATSGQLLREIAKDEYGFPTIYGASFSPDGAKIVIAANGPHVLDASSGQHLLSMPGHGDRVYDAVFSPDGSRIASCSRDHSVKIWDAQSGEEVQGLAGHGNRVYSVSFSPDGRRVISTSTDHTARVFYLGSPESPVLLRGHSAPVMRAAFRPDGRIVVTASDDGTVRVWEVSSEPQMLRLRGSHRHAIRRVLFSQHGSRLFTESSSDPGPFTGNKSPDQVNSWDPDGGTVVLLGDESPMAEAAVRAAIDRALQIDDAEERVLGTLHNATRDHVEQFRRSTNSWIAISQGEVTAFISTKAQESACIFPVEIVTLRAHPTASVWAGTEEVHSASPYGGFDDWRARYLYILKIEGQSDGNSAESLSRSGSRRSELECWQKFESAVGDIGARVQELRFDDARHLVSMIWEGLPHQVLFKSRLRELKAILIDEIDKAEYDSVRHFSEDVMKNVTALVQDGKFDQARGLLSKRRAVSRHLSQEVKKVLEGISRAEADWEGCRREAIVLQEVLIRIGTRNP